MEQSPSCETDKFSASQEIPHVLWDPKVSYRIHKCPHLIIAIFIIYFVFLVNYYPDYFVFS